MQDVQLLIYEQHPSQAACILGFKGATVKVQTVNFNSPPWIEPHGTYSQYTKAGKFTPK